MLHDHKPFEANLSAFKTALLTSGVINEQELRIAEKRSEETSRPLIWVLSSLGYCAQDKLYAAASKCFSLPLFQIDNLPDAPALSDLVPISFMKEKAIAPIQTSTGDVKLLVADPLDLEGVSSVQFKAGVPIERLLLPRDAILSWLEKCEGVLETDRDLSSSNKAELDEVRLKDLAAGAPVVEWVERLLALAVEWGASDIHLEQAQTSIMVRLRVDGHLCAPDLPPAPKADAIVSRLKLMAGLNIAERRVPQDGRIRSRIGGRDIDVRVATITTLEGESLVLRILDQSRGFLSLEETGLSGASLVRLRAAFEEPNGIVLVTGPTGSGKTTTLYAALQEMATADRKLISVEDPIEYQLSGVTQVPVKPEIGFDFTRSLRAMLRHDPNVIMVGEIRDLETAGIAIEAALTGHQVLSTLHTNSAVGTITRLMEMGVADYLLASALRAITAQRLIRRLCSDCKSREVPSYSLQKLLEAELGVCPSEIFRATGCAICRHTGYSGRTSISEVVSITQEIQHLISVRAPEQELYKAVKSNGWETLREAGFRSVARGETTIDEIIRVVGTGVIA